VCPNNFFRLTWEPPSASQDTLIGYNVYREDELYRFQTETILNHEESGGGNCPEDFVMYNGGQAFWIHVTAIYNSTQLESDYIDSVYCYGFAIRIEERRQSNLILHPNPTTGKIKVDIKEIKRILIIDQTGKIIKENKGKKEIDLSDYPKGMYFIKVMTYQGWFIEKIILK
jgi:hypothetical protein